MQCVQRGEQGTVRKLQVRGSLVAQQVKDLGTGFILGLGTSSCLGYGPLQKKTETAGDCLV